MERFGAPPVGPAKDSSRALRRSKGYVPLGFQRENVGNTQESLEIQDFERLIFKVLGSRGSPGSPSCPGSPSRRSSPGSPSPSSPGSPSPSGSSPGSPGPSSPGRPRPCSPGSPSSPGAKSIRKQHGEFLLISNGFLFVSW